MRITLLNPNSSFETTAAMVAIARAAAPQTRIDGITAEGAPLIILSPEELDAAELRVAAMAPGLVGTGAVIVAGFGDPGLARLRAAGVDPITGLAEAGMAEAAAGGRRFAVVTTTPALVGRIDATARNAGHAGYAGTWITAGDSQHLMADAEALPTALLAACRRACAEAGRSGPLGAIVIGGGPLAVAARAIAADCPVPLIEPVPAAVRRLRAHAGTTETDG